jgi:hypothetical protein
MRWEYYIFGLLLRMPPRPLNKKQTMLWKLPVIVFTYSFRGRTPGLAVVGAVSCLGSRPPALLGMKWNKIRSQIWVHLWLQQGGEEAGGSPQDKATMESFSPERSGEEPGVQAPQKSKENRGSQPPAPPSPARNPRPTLFTFSYGVLTQC